MKMFTINLIETFDYVFIAYCTSKYTHTQAWRDMAWHTFWVDMTCLPASKLRDFGTSELKHYYSIKENQNFRFQNFRTSGYQNINKTELQATELKITIEATSSLNSAYFPFSTRTSCLTLALDLLHRASLKLDVLAGKPARWIQDALPPTLVKSVRFGHWVCLHP